MNKDAGYFYDITTRLRGQLSRHHWKLGKPFTPNQEDAWKLLNEVEQIVQILRETERRLGDEKSEYAYKVRHTVLMHSRASKANLASVTRCKGSDGGVEPPTIEWS